jgi:hypothetical protein
MHLKKVSKNKELIYHTQGPLCTDENLVPGISFFRCILSLLVGYKISLKASKESP